MKKFKNVNEYLASLPKEQRSLLEKVRQTIKRLAPEAEEVISYQMPAFKLYGKYLVYFSAWKDHISLYPITPGIEKVISELPKYRSGKGTMQFPLDKPLPLSLIRKIVKIRIKENEAGLNIYSKKRV